MDNREWKLFVSITENRLRWYNNNNIICDRMKQEEQESWGHGRSVNCRKQMMFGFKFHSGAHCYVLSQWELQFGTLKRILNKIKWTAELQYIRSISYLERMALTNILLLSQIAGYVIALILSLCITVPMSLHQDEFKWVYWCLQLYCMLSRDRSYYRCERSHLVAIE